MNVDVCGLDKCGWMLMAVGDCGWKWMNEDAFEWMLMDVDECV
jgi:hypothetical protein